MTECDFGSRDNRYNGFGGKVEPGETLTEAAIRELKVTQFHFYNTSAKYSRLIQEEAGIDAPLEHAGSLLFMTKGAGWAFQIEIFSAHSYSGTPTE